MPMLPMPALAILAAAVSYWLIGALWYSVLFGRTWAAALTRAGWPIQRPDAPSMVVRLVATFIGNLFAATAVAWVLQCFGTTGMPVATRLALVLGVGVAASVLGVSAVWDRKPLVVYLIDASYHIIGVLVAALVLMQWRH